MNTRGRRIGRDVLFILSLRNHLFGNLLLLGSGVEDGGAVFYGSCSFTLESALIIGNEEITWRTAAPVRTLPIRCRRVVCSQMEFNEL